MTVLSLARPPALAAGWRSLAPLLAIPLLGLPLLVHGDEYLLYNAGIAAIYVLLATGYNILIGMAGQLAMSQIAFYGIGAYASALLSRDLGLAWPLAVLAAILLPVPCAWLMARAAVRFSGPYLAMVTFAFHSMALAVFVNWTALTNGWGGLTRIPPPRIGGLVIAGPVASYYLLVGFAGAGLYVAWAIRRARIGRAFLAIRENRLAARGAGIDTGRMITLAFCISAAYAGLAGALLAHFVRYIDPTSFGLPTLIDLLVIIIVGGRGLVFGVAVAAVGFVFALEYLRFLQDFKLIVFGLLLIVLINVSPDGLGALLRRTWGRPA